MPPALFDLLAAALLLGLAAWGSSRGTGKAAASLAVLLVSVEVASWLGPSLEHPLTQITGVSAAHRGAAGWTAALLAALLVGLVTARLTWARDSYEFAATGTQRWGGAGLGLLRAVILVTIAVHLLGDGDVLAREPAPDRAVSRAVRLLEPLRGPVARALRLPGAGPEGAGG